MIKLTVPPSVVTAKINGLPFKTESNSSTLFLLSPSSVNRYIPKTESAKCEYKNIDGCDILFLLAVFLLLKK